MGKVRRPWHPLPSFTGKTTPPRCDPRHKPCSRTRTRTRAQHAPKQAQRPGEEVHAGAGSLSSHDGAEHWGGVTSARLCYAIGGGRAMWKLTWAVRPRAVGRAGAQRSLGEGWGGSAWKPATDAWRRALQLAAGGAAGQPLLSPVEKAADKKTIREGSAPAWAPSRESPRDPRARLTRQRLWAILQTDVEKSQDQPSRSLSVPCRLCDLWQLI